MEWITFWCSRLNNERDERVAHSSQNRARVATDFRSRQHLKLLGRSFLCRNKSSKDMAFPHPQSRKDHCRKEDKPSCRGIVWKFFKWTINITEYRNGKDDVNPTKNRTLSALVHDWLFHGFCDPPRFMNFEPPSAVAEKLYSR